MTSTYSGFKTSKNLEQTGVYLDYGKFRVKVARAGGANKAYARLLEAKLRPFQRAIKTETIDPELAAKIMLEVFSKTVVLDWEMQVPVEGTDKLEWKRQLETIDGQLVTPNPENVAALLKELPDLFADIQEQTQKAAIFREEVLEANAGN